MMNYGNAAIILLTSQDTKNNFITFSVGFMDAVLLKGNSRPTLFKYLRKESSEEYSK